MSKRFVRNYAQRGGVCVHVRNRYELLPPIETSHIRYIWTIARVISPHTQLQDMLLLHFDLTSVVLRLVLPIILQLTSFAGPIM